VLLILSSFQVEGTPMWAITFFVAIPALYQQWWLLPISQWLVHLWGWQVWWPVATYDMDSIGINSSHVSMLPEFYHQKIPVTLALKGFYVGADNDFIFLAYFHVWLCNNRSSVIICILKCFSQGTQFHM